MRGKHGPSSRDSSPRLDSVLLSRLNDTLWLLSRSSEKFLTSQATCFTMRILRSSCVSTESGRSALAMQTFTGSLSSKSSTHSNPETHLPRCLTQFPRHSTLDTRPSTLLPTAALDACAARPLVLDQLAAHMHGRAVESTGELERRQLDLGPMRPADSARHGASKRDRGTTAPLRPRLSPPQPDPIQMV